MPEENDRDETTAENTYEPPAVDDVEMGDGPAVTSAGIDGSGF